MRRPLAIFASIACTLALLWFSTTVLQTAASWSQAENSPREDRSAGYTASVGYTVAAPAIDVSAGWQTVLQIQNTGQVTTSARIEFFGRREAECPLSPAPLAVRCVGPIPAGTTFTFDVGADAALTQTHSAIIRSVEPAGEDCGAEAGEPLAVLVQRTWLAAGEEPQIAASTYVGISPAVAGAWEVSQEAYVTLVPWTEITGTQRTNLHVQNIGTECAADVELEFISGSGCVPSTHVLPAIRPGESLDVDVAGMLDDGFTGSAWLRSPQPLAVVVDRRLDDGTLLTSHATGRETGYPWVDAPLVLQSDAGRHTRIRSQNASTRFTAFADLLYRTSETTPTLESELIICPGGTNTVDTGTTLSLPAAFTGTAALHSLGTDPDLPEVPGLVTEVDLLTEAGGGAYRAPNRITDTVPAPDVALPWLTRAYRPPAASLDLTYTSHVAVVNQSDTHEGFPSLSFYDASRLVVTYQPETPLGPRTMRLIDLGDVTDLPAGWHGSAIFQFLSTDAGATAGVVVLEMADGAVAGDAVTAYAGIVVDTPPQPMPRPSPTATPTSTTTATPRPTTTPTAAPATALPETYLPLLRR